MLFNRLLYSALYLFWVTAISFVWSFISLNWFNCIPLIYSHNFLSCLLLPSVRLHFFLSLSLVSLSYVTPFSFVLLTNCEFWSHVSRSLLGLCHDQIRNLGTQQCVDSAAKPEDLHKAVGLWPCHNQGGNQVSPAKWGQSSGPRHLPLQWWVLSCNPTCLAALQNFILNSSDFLQ